MLIIVATQRDISALGCVGLYTHVARLATDHDPVRACFVFVPLHIIIDHVSPGHFKNAKDVADPGSPIRICCPPPEPVHALHFYRALGSAFASLVDFHRVFL